MNTKKMFLSALFVAGVVSSALAFSVKTDKIYCKSLDPEVPGCPRIINEAKLTPNGDPIGNDFCSSSPNGPCIVSVDYYQGL